MGMTRDDGPVVVLRHRRYFLECGRRRVSCLYHPFLFYHPPVHRGWHHLHLMVLFHCHFMSSFAVRGRMRFIIAAINEINIFPWVMIAIIMTLMTIGVFQKLHRKNYLRNVDISIITAHVIELPNRLPTVYSAATPL